MADAIAATLPPKLYFRIGEVAELVGVEPHVLRYWEREFRTIRPTKSAKGQRVYSRRDVENLMRVRELLYRDGFTIAGAKKRLQQGPHDAAAHDEAVAEAADAPVESERPSHVPHAARTPELLTREELVAMRAEIASFLAELDRPRT
jgi:DNA-binding transcriptional MerR regulator